MQKAKNIFWVLFLAVITYSCSVSYSFTGASTANFKSYSVYDFSDRLRINPTLSDYVAEALKDKFTRQTSLDYANEGGDLEFEGSIVGYDVKPISVQKDAVAAENRLTVRINVKFTNNKDHDLDFETEFSAYYDFSSDLNLSDVEDDAVEEIIKQIVDDVFNKSVANW